MIRRGMMRAVREVFEAIMLLNYDEFIMNFWEFL